MAKSTPTFKQAVLAFLTGHIDGQLPLLMNWKCQYCDGQHQGNLLKKVKSVTVDAGDPNQIQLLNESGTIFGMVAISKNKKNNIDAAQNFQQKGIIYIQVSPPLTESQSVEDSLVNPKFVDICTNPKCKICGGSQHEKSMVIIDSSCWKCNGPMKVAVLDCGHWYPGPDEFSQEELTFAASKGTLIKNNYSNTASKSYPSNTCPSCSAFTGDHFLFTDHYTEAIYGHYAYERFPFGYFCGSCYMAE